MTNFAPVKFTDRRRFVIRGCGVLAACLTAPVWNLMTGCNRASDAEPAGPLTVTVAELPLNRRVRLEHDGRAVEVIRTETGVTARSLLCTHQGCNVRWVEKEQIYLCPCHEGKFDHAGIPVYGPPREPLRALPVVLTATEAVIGG
jgi:cytochrome b6-f complex iron-sulfur subunit